MKELDKLLYEYEEVKRAKREIEHQLTDLVIRYDGTLKDALKDGLVRLNFAAPPGFKHYLKES